jgi:hypothetical protein
MFSSFLKIEVKAQYKGYSRNESKAYRILKHKVKGQWFLTQPISQEQRKSLVLFPEAAFICFYAPEHSLSLSA